MSERYSLVDATYLPANRDWIPGLVCHGEFSGPKLVSLRRDRYHWDAGFVFGHCGSCHTPRERRQNHEMHGSPGVVFSLSGLHDRSPVPRDFQRSPAKKMNTLRSGTYERHR